MIKLCRLIILAVIFLAQSVLADTHFPITGDRAATIGHLKVNFDKMPGGQANDSIFLNSLSLGIGQRLEVGIIPWVYTQDAVAAFNLLNESLATALGNGIFAKTHLSKTEWDASYEREKSFYNEYYIDQSAKVIIPFLESWLKNKKTLANTKEFVRLYYSALSSRFQAGLSSPRIQLREMLLLADETYEGPVRKIIRKHIRVASMYTSQGDWEDPKFLEAYENKNDQNILLTLSKKNIDKLIYFDFLSKKDIERMKEGDQDFYFYTRPNSYYFIIVFAENDNKLEQKIEVLSKMDAMK